MKRLRQRAAPARNPIPQWLAEVRAWAAAHVWAAVCVGLAVCAWAAASAASPASQPAGTVTALTAPATQPTGPATRPAGAGAASSAPAIRPADVAAAAKWEPDIRSFEQADRNSPPPKGAILFVGSSSIRLWDLPKHFPDLRVINRGFGGSCVSDSAFYAERIILPYRPRTIVFYAGDNDVALHKSPQEILDDFNALVAKVRPSLPGTKIVFIAIKPSLARWQWAQPQRQANDLVRRFLQGQQDAVFLDIWPAMLDADGKPRKELFRSDGLHLNEEGYRLWTEMLMPYLKEGK